MKTNLPRAPLSFLRPLLKIWLLSKSRCPFQVYKHKDGAQLRPVNLPWQSPDMEAFRLLHSQALYQAQGLI